MKVTMIIGEPAAGKSTIVKQIVKGYELDTRVKLVPFHRKERRIVLGRYDDPTEKFPGTDRMSMACQPNALAAIAAWLRQGYVESVIFEGDRLGNASMARKLQVLGARLEILYVSASATLDARRAAERQHQSPILWKRTKTKIRNLLAFAAHDAGIPVRCASNNTPEELDTIVRYLLTQR